MKPGGGMLRPMLKQQAALARVFERTEALIEHLGLRNVGEVVLDPCHVLGFGHVERALPADHSGPRFEKKRRLYDRVLTAASPGA